MQEGELIMKSYKITINVCDVGGVYSAESIEEANRIAQEECDDIYNKLNGRCSVYVDSVEEVV
jgi:Fe2+ transport system protein B